MRRIEVETKIRNEPVPDAQRSGFKRSVGCGPINRGQVAALPERKTSPAVEVSAISPTASTALLAEAIRDGRGALGWTHEPPEGADWDAHDVGEDCLLHLEAAEDGSVPFPGWLQPPMPTYGRQRKSAPSDPGDGS